MNHVYRLSVWLKIGPLDLEFYSGQDRQTQRHRRPVILGRPRASSGWQWMVGHNNIVKSILSHRITSLYKFLARRHTDYSEILSYVPREIIMQLYYSIRRHISSCKGMCIVSFPQYNHIHHKSHQMFLVLCKYAQKGIYNIQSNFDIGTTFGLRPKWSLIIWTGPSFLRIHLQSTWWVLWRRLLQRCLENILYREWAIWVALQI